MRRNARAAVERAVHEHDPWRTGRTRAARPRRGRPRRRTLERWTHGAAPHPPRAPGAHRRGLRRGPGRSGARRPRACARRRPWPSGSPRSTSTRSGAARCAAPARRPRRWRERLGLEVTVDDGLAEFDREALSYIPIEELKAAERPALVRGARAARALPGRRGRGGRAHRRRPPGPARRGRVPRRRDQRLRRPRPRHRRPAVLPARPTRRSAGCSRRRTGERSIASLNEAAHLRGL